MKKLLVLMLVLGMASVASATVTYEFRDATGTTALTSIDVTTTTDFTFFVMGEVGDTPWKYGVYTSDFAGSPEGVADITGATVYDAAGDLGNKWLYLATYDGVDLLVDDVNPTVMPNVATGDWFKIDLSLNSGAGNGDTVQLDIRYWEDYSYDILTSQTLDVVPEPMTIALLGLGGLFLRRRR
jgi:hypothetical protein